jgi:hypothetical protein
MFTHLPGVLWGGAEEERSCPIGLDSCTAKAKAKADRLHKSEMSEPDFNWVIKSKDRKY